MVDSISASAPTQQVQVSGGQLSYRRFGRPSRVPLLLLQRFRGTMDHWDPEFLDRLATTREIILLDNAGVGGSEGVAADTIAGMAAKVSDFATALDEPNLDVLGWSMGGAVALSLALERPPLVRRLVLAGTGPGGVPNSPPVPERVWQVAGKPVNDDEDFLYLFYTDFDAGRDAGLASLRRIDRRLATSQLVVRPESAKHQAQAIRAWSAGHGSAFERLQNIQAPALVANGAHDIMVPAYNSYVMSQRIPNAKLVLYPNAGHGFLFQLAAAFAHEVADFLDA